MSGDRAMEGLGFTPQDTGPLATKLRESMAAKGVRSASVSPGKGFYTLTAEERAAIFLDVDWQEKRGHSTRIDCVDGPLYLCDHRTGKLYEPRCKSWIKWVWKTRHQNGRRVVSWFRRTWDVTIMRRDPYGVRARSKRNVE